MGSDIVLGSLMIDRGHFVRSQVRELADALAEQPDPPTDSQFEEYAALSRRLTVLGGHSWFEREREHNTVRYREAVGESRRLLQEASSRRTPSLLGRLVLRVSRRMKFDPVHRPTVPLVRDRSDWT
jgi:hypothetical protein